ncbi:hypothetical protein [uncultured Microscilla sp.]|uniref:hypothetical protein n=1 Tax=uncultured Microscilla sp. TaxID=432653 RepID=UPI002628A6DD|nr:hypothetical protein [uncultured Microscilla sp.]
MESNTTPIILLAIAASVVVLIPVVVMFRKFTRNNNQKTMGGMVNEFRQVVDTAHKPLYDPPHNVVEVSDKAVIEVAVANNGKVTSTVLCAKLDISVADATAKLESLHNQGIFTLDNTESGHLVYVLVDLDLMK